MTDPTFDTLEALEDWEARKRSWIAYHNMMGHEVNVDDSYFQIARVRAAHSHLLKGNDDAK